MIELENLLKANIEKQRSQLQELLDKINGEWGYEDGVYRFYHQSHKVYKLQNKTERIVESLKHLLPHCPLNQWFQLIVNEGTGRRFGSSDNDNWLPATRPILEAFLHAKYFLEMACKEHQEQMVNYTLDKGAEAKMCPVITNGWAALLTLYDIR